MDENTILVDIIDQVIPIQNNRVIPIVNKPNPVYGEPVTADQLKQLIQLSNLYIYEAGTKKTINGTNFYDYFPEENPGGGGGSGGGVTKEEVQSMINKSKPVVDSVVSTTSRNAVENGAMTNFVNSSIATNTANYIGLFNSIEELNIHTGTITNNDYAFVVGMDEAGNTKYVRYKYSDSTDTWLEEYTLNNSSYTAEEWAAIQSGIKSGDVEQINTNKTNIENLQTDKADKSELVGKNVTGTEYTINGIKYTAAAGAEIFNNYTNNVASGAYSHAEGNITTTIGHFSHAEGQQTTASGHGSHSEGYQTTAIGDQAHAEGNQTRTLGPQAHAEGYLTIASGDQSHSEGYQTTASGNQAHAEGYRTNASGQCSHVEGDNTTASGSRSHAEGWGTNAFGDNSHAEGCLTRAVTSCSHAEGEETIASGSQSHAEGYGTTASNRGAHAEGTNVNDNIISGAPTADGPKAYGIGSHAEGVGTVAGDSTNAKTGYASHAEGYLTQATGNNSHAEGWKTTASGDGSHAEGSGATASGSQSHAEGNATTASGYESHAEGFQTTAAEKASHAEGLGTKALKYGSHAEGGGTTASGDQSHAEGQGTTASGSQSHSEGYNTKASSQYQHVQGKFNIEDSESKYAFIIGNGTSDSERSNAFAVDWDGLIYVNNESTGVNVATLATDIETLKTSKANTSDVYTKTETDVKVADIKSDVAINKTTLGTSCKNLLKIIYPPKNANGITFALSDGVITLTGTATKTFDDYFPEYPYITTESSTWIRIKEKSVFSIYGTLNTTSLAYYKPNASTVTYATVSNNNAIVLEKGSIIIGIYIRINADVDYTGKNLSIMLRYADIQDGTFEPYKENIDKRITNNKSDIAVNKTTLGVQCKNLLKITVNTQTINGITFTVNDDKSITVTGKADDSTKQTAFIIAHNSILKNTIKSGKYILSGCPSGGSSSTYRMFAYHINPSTSIADDGNGVIGDFDYSNTTDSNIAVVIAKGYIDNINLIFYPMLRYADITDDTYEPYTPSLQEQIDSITNTMILPSGANLNNYVIEGNYVCKGVTVGNSIVNKPTGVTMFNLKILKCNTYITQIIHPATLAYVGKTYIRRGNTEDSSWTNWFEFSGTEITS